MKHKSDIIIRRNANVTMNEKKGELINLHHNLTQ